MSEGAIRKLRRKFIFIAMASIIGTMLLIAGMLYCGNLIINHQIVRNTINYIIENNGDLIEWDRDNIQKDNDTIFRHPVRMLEDIFATNSSYQSPESLSTVRYFALLYDEDGAITDIKRNHITAISEAEAEEYGMKALSSDASFGRFNSYYYQVHDYEDDSSIVVYMDGSNILHANTRILYLAMMLIGFGMIIAYFFIRVLSSKVIRHEMKNAELQKQFMTNASHELKTPLAVIRANTEMMEMLGEENEWTQSTMRQIDRMNGLIQNLVMITRADENVSPVNASDVDISKAIIETVNTFRSLAIQNNITLTLAIAENIQMRAEETQIRQLCSLLVDNAIKYCDENGEITISLTQRGKGINLVVSNSYAAGANVDYTRFFERFYREDQSHNVDRGGYGIGLSIAESLIRQYRGSIDAVWKNGVIYFNCLLKPALK